MNSTREEINIHKIECKEIPLIFIEVTLGLTKLH